MTAVTIAILMVVKIQTMFQVFSVCGKVTEEVKPSNARWKAMRMMEMFKHTNHFGTEEVSNRSCVEEVEAEKVHKNPIA